MDDLNQENQPPQNEPKENLGFNADDKETGAIIYFLGIIIVSVISVGYLVFKSTGLL